MTKTTVANPPAGLPPEALAERYGMKPFQGRQLFRWLQAKRVFDPDRMTDLGKNTRAAIAASGGLQALTCVELKESPATGTRKGLFQLPDGEAVEAVLIRANKRVTLCLSSQVGCALQCAFCATGLAGFTRNLAPGEIVEQALHLLAGEDLAERTPNIVYMGMGEPMRNYDNMIASIRLLMHEEGLGIGARKITVSTAGDVEGIQRFAREDWQVRLSVSLHAANDVLRDELVPLNRRYNLQRLIQAVQHYREVSGRRVTFEWTLLDGINDRDKDLDELAALARETQSSVNLIPWNPVRDIPYRPTPAGRCRQFRDALEARGVRATLRAEKGQDIDAACGQLRRIATG